MNDLRDSIPQCLDDIIPLLIVELSLTNGKDTLFEAAFPSHEL